MMVPENEAVVRRFMDELWSDGNLGAADELVAINHVHHLGGEELHGPDGVKGACRGFGRHFPTCASRSTTW
jgi:hypothetical protein